MAQNHGIFDRVGMAVKETKLGGDMFPGWVSELNKREHGSEDGWVVNSLEGYKHPIPTWLSEAILPSLTLSREYNIGYGRYPYRCTARHRYELIHVVDGRTDNVYCIFGLSGVNRAVQTYRHYANAWYEIDVEYVDGSHYRTGEVQILRNSLGFGLWTYNREFTGKLIQKVTLRYRLNFGDVVYHDTGDRSPRNYAPFFIFPANTNVGHRLYGSNVNRLVEYEGDYSRPTEGTPIKYLPIPENTETVQYIDYAGYKGWGGW